MLKNSGVLFLLPCALIAGMWAMSHTPSGRQTLDSLVAGQESEEARIARRQETRRIFLLHMEPVLSDLSAGVLTLRQASDRLIHLSALYHADYVANVMWAERGTTLVERVARNCVRHFREASRDMYMASFTQATRVLPELERQLAQVIREEN